MRRACSTARRCRGGGHAQISALVPWALAQGTCSLVNPQEPEWRPHADPGCGAVCTGSRLRRCGHQLEECSLVRPQMQQERRPHADPGSGAACTGSRRWCLGTGLGMSSPLVNLQLQGRRPCADFGSGALGSGSWGAPARPQMQRRRPCAAPGSGAVDTGSGDVLAVSLVEQGQWPNADPGSGVLCTGSRLRCVGH